MKKIRYAIAGFGGIAETRIAREGFALDTSRFASLRYAEAVGAYDPNSGRRSAAATLGLSWYDDYRQLLADSGVDAVYVASNNATHAELALAALRAGKHVIVEKPIATRISAARELVNTASRRRLALSVDHMVVYNSTNVLARQAVKDRRIGVVNDCCFHMEFAYSANLQCYLDPMLQALSEDVVTRCKKGNGEKIVVAKRENLSKAIEQRIYLNFEYLMG